MGINAIVGLGDPPTGAASWKPLRIGAGGYVTQLDVRDDDGTTVMFIGTDVGGGFVWNSSTSQWDQVCTVSRLPDGEVDPDSYGGVYAVAIAPSDPQTLYMMYEEDYGNGYVYVSSDFGANWTRTDFPMKSMYANEQTSGSRTYGERLAVDPSNADHVIAGVGNLGSGGGAWRSTDGGTNFSQITDIPAPNTHGVTGIVFDHNSSVVGGKTQTVYAFSCGNGLYRSTDGGANWSLESGGPSTLKHAQVAEDGIYYCCGNGSNDVWKWESGTGWTNIAVAQQDRAWHVILPDPSNSARVVLLGYGGRTVQSTDRGANWSGINWSTNTRVATDVPWLAETNEDYLSMGSARWDPNVSDKIWIVEGIGVWSYSFPSSPSFPLVYTSRNKGIEQMVANEIVSPANQVVVAALWDRPLFYLNDHDNYPSDHHVSYDQAIICCWSVDVDPQDSDHLVALVNYWAVEDSAYSEDGGQNWTNFSMPSYSSPGGCMAVNGSNIIFIPADTGSNSRYYSTNNGTSWNTFSLPGVSDYSYLFNNYMLKRRIVVGDPGDADTFYLLYMGGTSGVFKTTNGGATWTRVYTGDFGGSGNNWNGKLKAVPGQTGHLVWTAGDWGGSVAGSLHRSTDGGATWGTFPDVLEAKDFGFSAAAPGESYPAMAFAGWYDGVYGIWRTDDPSVSSPTWTKIGDYPLDWVDQACCMCGDSGTYDRWYVGYLGTSFRYYGV